MFDRSLLPEAVCEFVVLADTHYMIDPGDSEVEFESRRRQSARADVAWRMVASLGCPRVFHLGDLVQEFPGTDDFPRALGEAIEQFRRHGVDPHPVAGNHDVGDKPDPTMPTRPVTAGSLADYHEVLGPSWYSLDHGPAHMIVLNSQIMNTDLPEAVQQQRWFEQELAEHADRRLFVFLHLPPYLNDPGEPALGHYDNIAEPARGWLLDLVARYEIELLLAAHVHCAFYDRVNRSRYQVVNSTSFTRPGFCHMFTAPAPPDQGRDDADKLGVLLCRIRDDRTDLHWLRTGGRTEIDSRLLSGSRLLVTRTPANLPDSPLGVSLTHPLSNRSEIPLAWPSSIRQTVRNDYPLLACLELGTTAVRVPATDLADPFLQRRIEILRDEQVKIVATSLWANDLDPPALIERHGCQVDTWEWQLAGTDRPDKEQLAMLNVLDQAGVSQALSAVVPGQSLAGKQHPRTRIGFDVETIAELDRQLVVSGARVDRVLCRLSPAPTLAAAIDEIARLDSLQAIGNIDVQLELLGQDVRSATNQVAESLAAVTRLRGSRLFIDPLIDFDRTMDVRHGLLDPFCNPRPAFHVLRCLNTILAVAGNAFGSGESRTGWLETGSVVFGTIETSTASIGLLLPATPVPVDECPAEVTAWCSQPGPLGVYHLVDGLLTETTTDGLAGALAPCIDEPLLLLRSAAAR
ncbi:MAG: metallophosphoesterase [Planctomycetaceae bacterium]